MSVTTSQVPADGLTAVSPFVTRCKCEREFVASTPARVGVTISNANRHVARCATAQAALLAESSEEVSAVVAKGVELAAAGREFEISEKSGVARMVTVSNTAYVTTDGRFATMKDGDDKATAWSLYTLAPVHAGRGGPVRLSQHRTCTAAFGADGVLTHKVR